MEMKYKGAFLVGILIIFVMAIGNVNASISYDCYQESANVSTACGSSAAGVYSAYNTSKYFEINYSKTVYAVNATWVVKQSGLFNSSGIRNVSLPEGCFNNSENILRLRLYSDLTIAPIAANSYVSSYGQCYYNGAWRTITANNTLPYANWDSVGWSVNPSSADILKLYDGDWETHSSTVTESGIPTYWMSPDEDKAGNYSTIYEEAIIWHMTEYDEDLTYSNYNTTAYETDYESFTANFSIHPSYSSATANLIYDSVTYTATSSGSLPNITFTKSNLVIPQVTTPTNKSFYWNLLLTNSSGTYSFNTSTYNQTVRPIYFVACNGSIGTQFLNFSGKDEVLLTWANFTIDSSTFNYWLGDGSIYETYQYTNTTEWGYHRFCFNVNRTLNMNYTILYSGGDYFPRSRTVATTTYSNATTDVLLYLLGTASGVASTFITVDNSYNVLTGATVTAQREIGGVATTVATGVTDTSGSVTFYLNPFATHTITAERNGCTKLYTINPSATTYQINVDCGTTTSFKSFLDGILYQRGPKTGVLQRGVTTFDYYVTADWFNNTIIGTRFDIINGYNGTVYYTNITYAGSYSRCNATACYSSLSIDTTGMNTLIGRYYVITNLTNTSGYPNSWILLEGDAQWKLISSNVSTYNTIKNFFEDFKAIFQDINYEGNTYTPSTQCGEETDSTRKAEFSRFVFIFLAIAIILAIIGRVTGYDAQNPGAFIWLMFFIVLIGTIMGGINGEGLFYLKNLKQECNGGVYSVGAHFINNWFLAFIMAEAAIMVTIAVIRRVG